MTLERRPGGRPGGKTKSDLTTVKFSGAEYPEKIDPDLWRPSEGREPLPLSLGSGGFWDIFSESPGSPAVGALR